MRKFSIGCTLVLVLLAGGWGVRAASANFSGTWVLDKSKSEGLPQQWQNLESYTMVVTADDKQVTVENKIVGGARPSGEPGGAGGESGSVGGGRGENRGGGGRGEGRAGGQADRGGRRGFGMGMPVATYRLDGTETKIESAGGRGGGVSLKGQLKNGGQVLELTSSRTFNFQGNETTRTTLERWELADGGKTLKVKRTTDTPQGTRESTLVFNRQ
jgi:hypothetical protein